MLTWFRTMALVNLVGSIVSAQDLPSATPQHGSFAFPNSAGTQLLATSDLAQPASLHTALCNGGRRLKVELERRQNERANDGRQWAANFDKLAGAIFRIPEDKVDESAGCFLASDALLSSATVLPATPDSKHTACEAGLRSRIASSRSRQVSNCSTIATLAEGKRLILVEFERRGKDALAAIALVDGERMTFADYPAVFSGNGESLWRVDDGGRISPDDFRIVFLLQKGTGYTMGVEWLGAEGESLGVFVSAGDNRFTQVIEDSWYRSPL
jgi:hypothetical protein